MSRAIWGVLLGTEAILSVAVYAFGRTQVSPCLGGSVAGQVVQDRCVAAWRASRPLLDRLLETPIPAVLLSVGLLGLSVRLTRPEGEGLDSA